jgi:hypothetical protein
VPAEEREPVLESAVPAGTAVRIETAEGSVSNAVCVLGWRALRRLRPYTGRVAVDQDTVFDNLADAEAFAEDLAALRPWLPASSPPPGPAARGGEQNESPTKEQETWEEYLQGYATSKLGEPMLYFALPLPQLAPHDPLGEARDDEEDDPDGSRGNGSRKTKRSPLELSEQQRRNWRRWCSRLAERSPQLVHLARLAALRLLIRRVARGLWDRPADWVPVIARASSALTARPTAQGELREAVASLAAVGLAIVRSQVEYFGAWDPLRPFYEQTLTAVRELLPEADERLVATYAADLADDPALAMDPAEIMEIASDAYLSDPLDVAITTLEEEHGWHATRAGKIITLTDPIPGPAQVHAALRAVGLAANGAPVAAVATGEDRAVLCAWNPPHLVFVIRNPHLTRGQIHELGDGVGPRFYAEHPDDPLPAPQRWDGSSPPQGALRALQAAGITPDTLATADLGRG